MDPLRHPDLIDVARSLRSRWEQVVEAEQAAARATWWRKRSVRDRLIDAEDREEVAAISSLDGRTTTGVIHSVGSDCVAVRSGGRVRFVLLHQIVAVSFEDAE